MFFPTYALTEPLVPASHRDIHGWPGILKGVANAIFSYEQVLRAIENLTRLELEESDTDEESERTRTESDTENESELTLVLDPTYGAIFTTQLRPNFESVEFECF